MMDTLKTVQALVPRIDAAIQRIVDGSAPMRIPADDRDPDLVLADCRALCCALIAQLQAGEPTGTAPPRELTQEERDALPEVHCAGCGGTVAEHAPLMRCQPVAYRWLLSERFQTYGYGTKAQADAKVAEFPGLCPEPLFRRPATRMTSAQVEALRSEHGWAKETIRAIEAVILGEPTGTAPAETTKAWIKTGQKGKFMSLALTPKEQQAAPAKKGSGGGGSPYTPDRSSNADDPNDDIPF